jgi:hypothetical protein
MPRKKKEKSLSDQIHKVIRDGVPPHVAARRDSGSSLADALITNVWNRAICPDTGVYVECDDPNAGRRNANKARADISLRRAIEVRSRYGDQLDDRRCTNGIAAQEGVDPRTVRRWRQKTRQNGQA